MTALSKLHSIRPYSFLLAIFALLLVSCNDDDDDDSPTSPPPPPTIEFGATYEVLNDNLIQDGNPILVGDSVSIFVGYSGCADNHEFAFRTRVLSDTRAEVWLEKITEDESCSAFFILNEVHRVPFSVLERDEIFLVGPDFYTFRLR